MLIPARSTAATCPGRQSLWHVCGDNDLHLVRVLVGCDPSNGRPSIRQIAVSTPRLDLGASMESQAGSVGGDVHNRPAIHRPRSSERLNK